MDGLCFLCIMWTMWPLDLNEWLLVTILGDCLQGWDPVLILAQITVVQCLFYVSLGVLQGVVLGKLLIYVVRI